VNSSGTVQVLASGCWESPAKTLRMTWGVGGGVLSDIARRLRVGDEYIGLVLLALVGGDELIAYDRG
jgi:hypothetical protein